MNEMNNEGFALDWDDDLTNEQQEFVLLPDDLLVHLVLAPVEDIDHRRNADGEEQQQQQQLEA